MRLWITRAQPGADATAQRLRDLGHQPLVGPVLEVRDLGAQIDLDGVGALAFTSANGVRAFARVSEVRDLPVFAVGDATATVAQAAGFRRVESAAGDVSALADYVRVRREGVSGAVLHLGAGNPAGDLVGELTRAGVSARAVHVYETVEITSLPDAIATALERGTLDGLLLHSPKAAKVAARLMKDYASAGSRLKAFGLSVACLTPLDGVGGGKRVAAPQPTEDDLLAELVRS